MEIAPQTAWDAMTLTPSRCTVRMTVVGFAFAVLVLGPPGTASGAVIPYYTYAEFNAALVSGTFSDDYETYADGTMVPNGGQLLGGFPRGTGPTYMFSDGNTGFIDGTTYVPFSGNNSFARNDVGSANEFGPGSSVTLTFPTPVTAVSVFFNGNGAAATQPGDFRITTDNGEFVENADNAIIGNFAQFPTLFFLGLTSDTPFSSVTFGAIPGAATGFTFDDVQAGIAQTEGAPVPTPAALFVFGGLMAIGFARRRKS